MTAGASARPGPAPCSSPLLREAPEAGEAAVRVEAAGVVPAVAEAAVGAVEGEEAAVVVAVGEAAVEVRFRR